MAAQDGLTFEGTFNNSSTGLFKTNTTKDIGSDDMRALVTAIRESYLNRTDDLVDEDNMVSNSAVRVPSQQSVKAYVDAQVAGAGDEHFLGVYADETALTTAHATANEGDYALVDTGGSEAALYIWDDTDTEWVASGVTTIVPDASETTKGIAELATQAETNTGTDDARIVTPLKLHTKVVGVQDLFIPASAMWPRVTNGCSPLTQTEMTTSLFNIQTLDFNQTTQQFAQFQIVPPRKWNNGTVTFVPYWTAASGTGTVQWGLSLGAYSNDDALTVALGTAQTSDDTLIATNDLHIGPESSAITVAGSPADADLLAVQISRNPASDTLSADAKLLGISIRFTMDAAKDA